MRQSSSANLPDFDVIRCLWLKKINKYECLCMHSFDTIITMVKKHQMFAYAFFSVMSRNYAWMNIS